MAKMYYSAEEAAKRLGKTAAELAQMVRSGQIRAYPDGAKQMFRVGDIDALAGPGPGAESEEIQLTPADTGGDVVALSEADKVGAGPAKEETAITSEGISIFDEEDLEIEAADPMAKTTIAPSVAEQVSTEGVGSGSGLLDLTRESDDTSLGEVLDHIEVEAPVAAGSVAAAPIVPEAEAIIEAPAVVEEIDPSAGLFGGLVAAACIVMLLVGAVAIAALQGLIPPYLDSMQRNLAVVLGASVGIGFILAVIGLVLGKSIAGRAAALQRTAP